jgi:hypothetical protein
MASSTTKTGRHEIAEILLKVALSTKNQIKSNLKHISNKQFPFSYYQYYENLLRVVKCCYNLIE